MPLRLVNWNVEWATPRSPRRDEILRRIRNHEPELVCLTETHKDLLSQAGHTICSRHDYGYPIKPGRRKVALWSRNSWQQIDDIGKTSLPPGRFVSGTTETSIGKVTVVGVCIPWSGSRTEARRGVDRKKRWEDHANHLAGFSEALNRMDAKRVVVIGDFNQRIGQGSSTPIKLQRALGNALPPHMTIVTSGLDFRGRMTIDHIALSQDLTAESMGVISNIHGKRKLSDHFGVFANLSIL